MTLMTPGPLLALIDGVQSSASRLGPEVDAVFVALLATCTVVTVGLGALILFFLIRYRRGSPAPRPPLRIAAWKFETAWISATTLIFLVFFFAGARVYLQMATPPPGATEIVITGRQWMWDVRHGNGRRELDELHVPVGQPIVLRLGSEDVIHSFAVPAFRLKQDVVPGRTVTAWFEAMRPGRYQIFCDQYCGSKHAWMNGTVIALPPAEFAAWLNTGSAEVESVRRGQAAFIHYGCAGCHSGNSSVRAPRLEGVAGHLVPIEDRQLIRADDAYLRDSILQPNQHIVAGYAPLMPSFQGQISEGDLLDLLAYLHSLANQKAPAPAQLPP